MEDEILSDILLHVIYPWDERIQGPAETAPYICIFLYSIICLFFSVINAINSQYQLEHIKIMEQLIADMKAQIEAILTDIDKKDNAAARLRVRKATLELEKLGKEYRKQSVK